MPQKKSIKLILIVAMSKNSVIGINGDLPWHITEDLKRFKLLTINNFVLMGRKTFDSILNRLGKPLPDRTNIILTRDKSTKEKFERKFNQVFVFHDLDSIFSWAKSKNIEKIFVAGGSEIYELIFPYADELNVTHLNLRFEGDAFFPKINKEEWSKKCEKWKIDQKNQIEYRYCNYIKTKV